MAMKRFSTAAGFLLFAAALPLQPLLTGHIPWQGDGLLHLYRVAALEQSLGWTALLPRWLPVLGTGYGFPLFNYYAPFSYYFSLLLRGISLPLPIATGAGYAAAFFLLIGSAYGWATALWARAASLTIFWANSGLQPTKSAPATTKAGTPPRGANYSSCPPDS